MKEYGLIGFPLEHSFSKKYFTEKFQQENLNAVFHHFPLSSINEFPELLKKNIQLSGIAVTIPYKEKIIPFLDYCNYDAELIGAVNCIALHQNKLIGYNTDYIGFLQSITPLLTPHHKKALLLGTGGASKAVRYAFEKLKIPCTLISRSGMALNYQQLSEADIQEHCIIINCTPVGMFPHTNEFPPIPYQYLTPHHLLFDLVYNPIQTAFLQKGAAMGASVKNGYEMLVLQAEENWKIWSSN